MFKDIKNLVRKIKELKLGANINEYLASIPDNFIVQ